MEKTYYVYLMTNMHDTVLYAGVTNNLQRRALEHVSREEQGFTQKYRIVKVVWYEIFSNPVLAIAAEKRIKGWSRKKKIALIKKENPYFRDLLRET